MTKLAIRSRPCTPVPESDLEDWLEIQLDQLRKVAPGGIIRLSRVAQKLPNTEIAIGWLIELELSEESIRLGRNRVADALTDLVTAMSLLGLQPQALTTLDRFDRAGDLGSSEPSPLDAPVLDYPGLK